MVAPIVRSPPEEANSVSLVIVPPSRVICAVLPAGTGVLDRDRASISFDRSAVVDNVAAGRTDGDLAGRPRRTGVQQRKQLGASAESDGVTTR